MTLSDCIYSVYNNLLDAGWHLQDVDSMDMLGFFRLRAWNAKKKKEESRVFIDDVWGNLSP